MNISILSSDPGHAVIAPLRTWMQAMADRGHKVVLVFDKADLVAGDILFLVSCHQMLRDADRARFKTCLVLHASDLPQGRGWSPHVWAIAGGSKRITVCLLEACDPVDSGPVWLRSSFDLEGHELLPEISAHLFAHEVALMTRAVEEYDSVVPQLQPSVLTQPLRRRTPADSELDPAKSLAEQFDLLRVVDNERFPAFFRFRGHSYVIKIEKTNHG
jgi:methionyl-tRNA formyltransferase